MFVKIVAIISDVSNLQFYHSECRASIRCQNIADPKSKNVSIFVQDDLLHGHLIVFAEKTFTLLTLSKPVLSNTGVFSLKDFME